MSAPPEPDRVIRAFPTATGQPCRNFREGGHGPRIPGHHEIPVAVHTQSVTSTADNGPGQFPHLTQTGNTTTAHPPLDRGSHDSRIAQRSRQNPALSATSPCAVTYRPALAAAEATTCPAVCSSILHQDTSTSCQPGRKGEHTVFSSPTVNLDPDQNQPKL